MPKLTIDGIEVEVPAGASVLQACEAAGKEIPRFCYHERLSVAGNCRMCLVEIEKARGPVASCAMPAGDGMVVHTDSDLVRQARAGVMEFLLLNHPLDCPICDQGGECDLQDQAMAYGMDHGRYEERKRAVRDKFMGPLIATHMTRCIHCTRCVRFMTEIAGVPELGLLGRGEHAEISSYLERAIDSEVSGNIIDLCPVGALTSRPYAFHARPWELRKTETIDVLDAVGTNIRVDARGPAVLRVLPRLNDDVNQEWLADKGRFAVDGLRRQRLDRCYIRREGRLQPATWPEAFQAIAERLGALAGDRIAALAGDLVDVESAFALKGLMTALGSPHTDCRQDGAALDPRARVGWLFNTTIAGIDAADACLLIGTHPRWEAPIVNLRLRERWMNHDFRAARIGPAADLTWPVEDLGESPSVLQEIADGTHPFAEVLRGVERPMLILGMGALTRPDGPAMLAAARAVAEATGMVSDDWKGFNVLHSAGGRVGALEAGFLPGAGGRDTAGILEGAAAGGIEAVWLLGADEIDMGRLGDAFVIYQGHHGDAGAHRADVILPGAAYTEKDATYVNLEGRPQRARLAAFAPGEAREDWKILRAASEVLGHTLPYDSLTDLRAALAEQAPHLVDLDRITPAEWAGFGTPGALDPAPLTYPIANYYMTDPISRASETMAECTRTFLSGTQQDRTGTDG